MKQNGIILTAFAAIALLAAACSKEPIDNDDGGSIPGTQVSVTLPVQVEDAIPASVAAQTKSAINNTEEGFSVSLGDEAPETPSKTRTPHTRAMAQELTNVWVLQFNSAGRNVSTTNVGTLAAGAYLTVPSLQVGTGYTLYVVANGRASGLSTSNPATISDIESKMIHKDPVTDPAKLPLVGKLTGVEVVNLGDGKGMLKLIDTSVKAVTLKRIQTEITLTVDFYIWGYTLTGAQLYNVPVGSTYDWNSATTTFPDNTVAANFAYTSTASAGMAPVTTSTSGFQTTYKWFTGDNRRGNVAGITAQSDRNRTKAPAYATFAQITLTNTSNPTQKILYDLYIGSGAVTNFDILRNHTYKLKALIEGDADFQEALIDTDARVSGVGFPVLIYLTDTKTDSPILISPKSMESTSAMNWGPASSSISESQDIFNGKANTDAIMATSTTAYPAAKHCRNLGDKFYLPAQAELMLMWTYLLAIPEADRPVVSPGKGLWSSTERNGTSSNAWFAYLWLGYTQGDHKEQNNFVRCLREHPGVGAQPQTWKYPKVQSGNTIVSRDAAKGIKEDALLTQEEKTWLKDTNSPTTTYNEKSAYNKVSTKFQVAPADASASSTWDDAFAKCKNYSTGTDAGSWRLPTQRELMLIWMFKSKLTGCNIDSANGTFWSGTEYSGGGAAWYVRFPAGMTLFDSKSGNRSVRCVKDL